MSRSLHATKVDAVGQHRQLRCVELGAIIGIRQMDLESFAVQALVPEHRAALLKRQNLRAIPAAVSSAERPSKPLRMSVAPVKRRILVVTDRPNIAYRSMNRSNSAT